MRHLDRLVNGKPWGILSEIDGLRQMRSGKHTFECGRCSRKTRDPAELVWLLVRKTSSQMTTRGHLSLGMGEEAFVSQFTLCGDCVQEKQRAWRNFVVQRINLKVKISIDFERVTRPLRLNKRPGRLDFEPMTKRGHRRREW